MWTLYGKQIHTNENFQDGNFMNFLTPTFSYCECIPHGVLDCSSFKSYTAPPYIPGDYHPIL